MHLGRSWKVPHVKGPWRAHLALVYVEIVVPPTLEVADVLQGSWVVNGPVAAFRAPVHRLPFFRASLATL